MAPPIVSRRKANVTFNGVFLIGLGLLFFTETWWPGILLVIGFALATRQYLRGRVYDVVLTTIIFGGLFIGSLLDWNSYFLVSVMFTLAGIYLLFSEWGLKHNRVGKDDVEDMNQELDDVEHPD